MPPIPLLTPVADADDIRAPHFFNGRLLSAEVLSAAYAASREATRE